MLRRRCELRAFFTGLPLNSEKVSSAVQTRPLAQARVPFFFSFVAAAQEPLPKLDLRLPSTSCRQLRRVPVFIMMQKCLGERQSQHVPARSADFAAAAKAL